MTPAASARLSPVPPHTCATAEIVPDTPGHGILPRRVVGTSATVHEVRSLCRVFSAAAAVAVRPWGVMNDRTSIPRCLVVAFASAVLLVATYLTFVRTYVGQIVDERGRIGAGQIGYALVPVARRVLGAVPVVGLLLLIALAIAGLALRRVFLTIVALCAVGAANSSTQLLKHVILVRPNLAATTLASNSFPSGHITFIASLALAALLVSPPRLRRAVAVVGGAAVVLVGMLLLAAQWHRPSDVVGGILVVTFWGGVAGAVAAAVVPTPHTRAARVSRGVWLMAGGLAVASTIAVLPVIAASSVHGSHVVLAGVAGMAAVAAAGTAATAAIMRTCGVLV